MSKIKDDVKLDKIYYDGIALRSLSVPDSYVAYTYSDNLTVLENIYALWNEMRTLNYFLTSVVELVNAMVDFLNGEGLKSHVTEKLEEWLEDGTLEELINDALFNSKADKVWVEGQIELINGKLDDLETKDDNLNTKIDNVKENLEEDIANVLIEVDKNKFEIDKIKNTPIDLDMVLAMRYQVKSNYEGGQSDTPLYSNPQGSCVVNNKTVIVGSTNVTDSGIALDNKGKLREYDIETGNLVKESDVEYTYHANGLTYDEELGLVYVAHSNTQLSGGGSSYNNNISVFRYSNFAFVKEVVVAVPSGRRVKSVSIDIITGKLYVSDDVGAWEVDKDFNILRTIIYDEQFYEENAYVLGQMSGVFNGFFYFLRTNHEIAVFDNDGNYIKVFQIPVITKDYRHIGREIQSLSFNEYGQMFIISRVGQGERYSDDMIVYLMVADVFKGVTNPFPFTFNEQSGKWIYVDSNSSHPRPNGSTDAPFNNIYEAWHNYIKFNPVNYLYKIWLKNGVYTMTTITGGVNRQYLYIEADTNVTVEGLRLYNVDYDIRKVKFKKSDDRYPYKYLFTANDCNGLLLDCSLDGSHRSLDTGINVSDGRINVPGNTTISNVEYGLRLSRNMLAIVNNTFTNVDKEVTKTNSSILSRGTVIS